MYYVYLLKSTSTNWIYVGYTSDLKKRIEQHKTGQNFSTKKHLPVELSYYEAYRCKDDATNREKHLKQHGNALRLLKKRIYGSLNQN